MTTLVAPRKTDERRRELRNYCAVRRVDDVDARSFEAWQTRRKEAARKAARPSGASIGLHRSLRSTTPTVTKEPGRARSGSEVRALRPSHLHLAVEAVLAAREPVAGVRAQAAALLRQAVSEEIVRRPRHAAVALALHDALLNSVGSQAVSGDAAALEIGARLLLSPFISDDDERVLLDRLNRSWDRVPALDEGPLAVLFHREAE
jgi:hypothetical protein